MLENGKLIQRLETEIAFILMAHLFLEKLSMDYFKALVPIPGHFQKHQMSTKILSLFIQVSGFKVACMDRVNLLMHVAQSTKEILLTIYTCM